MSQDASRDNATGDDYSRDAPPAPATGLWVIRGYNDGHDFSSLLDLPREDAIAAMEKNTPTRGRGPARPDGTRDQSLYYADRKATDDWLRDNAPVTASRENPVFFSLTDDPDRLLKLMTAHGGGYQHYMVVPLDKLNPAEWSFTYDDSMGNFFSRGGGDNNQDTANFLRDKHPLHGTVLDTAGAVAAVAKYGMQLANGQEREVEAQFWGKKFDPAAHGGYVVTPGLGAPKMEANDAGKKPEPDNAAKSSMFLKAETPEKMPEKTPVKHAKPAQFRP